MLVTSMLDTRQRAALACPLCCGGRIRAAKTHDRAGALHPAPPTPSLDPGHLVEHVAVRAQRQHEPHHARLLAGQDVRPRRGLGEWLARLAAICTCTVDGLTVGAGLTAAGDAGSQSRGGALCAAAGAGRGCSSDGRVARGAALVGQLALEVVLQQ